MLTVHHIDLRLLDIRTRIPFRYGITTLRACPHLIIRAQVEVDGKTSHGLSADLLPPKWFTKNPDTSFQDDARDMIAVIQHATRLAQSAGPAPSVFDLVNRIHAQQQRFARDHGYPPLLYNFGVSLVERALIDAFCRAMQTPFARAIRQDLLGIRFDSAGSADNMLAPYAALAGTPVSHYLPAEPLGQVYARHTVGMLDYLTDDQIPPDERVADGLPQSLKAAIAAYGLSRFKIKLAGNFAQDSERLRQIFAVIQSAAPNDWRFTLDANENFHAIAPFREHWQKLIRAPFLRPVLHRMDFIEQPLHRDVALSDEVQRELLHWPGRPPIIIDESDGHPGAAIRALECGYSGTSHKNCKGILKGLANVCYIAHQRRQHPGRTFLLSGEDLCNIGPIALNQDLAFNAAVGIANVERNGHHFIGTLGQFPRAVQGQLLKAHPDLYHPHPGTGDAALTLQAGQLNVASLLQAPFGVGINLDLAPFTPLEKWTFPG